MEIDLDEIKKSKSIQELLEFGILNIDKPTGPTSFYISEFVKNALQLKKTSHFGTLDPKVSGVLPIAMNRACKLTGFFIGEDKEYVGIMRIHKDSLLLDDIKNKIHEKFMGKIKQLPPKKSRVKRAIREREIRNFEILEKDGKDVLFRIWCEGGTYVRKLIHDLGESLGIGAHMLELRRVRAGIFREEDTNYPSLNIYEFERIVKEYKKGNIDLLRKVIIPGEVVSKLYPSIQIKKEFLKSLFHGSPLFYSYLLNYKEELTSQIICVFEENKFVGLYKITREGKIFARPEFVFQKIKNK
ncbi:MAG: RNA-guided pseudouridylation complex pseudouridine synthase subunit Cbf5 [Candidatus Pacearchaeota archaeon]